MTPQIKLLKDLRENKIQQYCDIYESTSGELFGEIKITTGEIVANDPLTIWELEPFTTKVPVGSFPVYLYIRNHRNYERVAFAEIRFTENLPVRFEMAVTEGQDVRELSKDEYFGYGVDSGTGCFMDKAVCDEINAIDDEFKELQEALENSYVDTYETANVEMPSGNGNIIAFSTGYGDGSYASYFGYDENDKLCCLITEFQIIEVKEEVSQYLHFDNFNFKLAIIDELMYNQEVLTPKIDIEDFDYQEEEVCEATLEYFKNLEIPREFADKIENLYIDGGNEIYHQIINLWSGEDEFFDIEELSHDEVCQFENLKEIEFSGLCPNYDEIKNLLQLAGVNVAGLDPVNTRDIAAEILELLGLEGEIFRAGQEYRTIFDEYFKGIRAVQNGESDKVPIIILPSNALYDSLNDNLNDGEEEIDRKRIDKNIKKTLKAKLMRIEKLFKQWQDSYEPEALAFDAECDEVDLSPQINMQSFWDFDNECTKEVIIVKIKFEYAWQVFAYIPFGGWNSCPNAVDMMTVAKYWFESYDAVPAVIGSDTLEILASKQDSFEDSARLAYEQYLFCADIVDQGLGSIKNLATQLKDSTVWAFWWD